MKLNEIREIVDFMKEAGVCELEYQERHTSIRLKLSPPPPPCPAPEEGDKGLGEAAEKMRKGAALAGSAVADTVRAGASYLKSKRDEYLAGTPGAFDVELSEAEEHAPEAPEPESAPKEMPVVGEVPEYVPQDVPQEEAPEGEDEPEEAPEDPVKLDTDAAKEAVARTAEVVVNAARAAVELGAAGLRRGGSLLSDLLRPSAGEPEDAEVTSAEADEEAPEEAPDEEEADRKEEEV